MIRFAGCSTLVALLIAFVSIVAGGGLQPTPVAAHPLGNFTVNTYSRLAIYADAIQVRYVLDMAEIPTFQERQRIDTDADGAISEGEARAYIDARAPAIVANVELTLDGARADLEAVAPMLEFVDGDGGLETLRLAFWLEVPLSSADAAGPSVALRYADGNYTGRLGWRELIVQPTDSALLGTFASDDPTNELRAYPADQLRSPRMTREVALEFIPGITSAPPLPESVSAPSTPTDMAAAPGSLERTGESSGLSFGRFEELIAPDRLTLPLAVIALLGAAAFGAVHALEPGHGKTLVAAYFVGTRGTAPQAVLLGLIVAATHTVGVFAIGVVTLVGSKYVLPEDLYPWLSAASGLVLAAIGFTLLRPRLIAMLRHRLADRAPVGEPVAPDHHHGEGHGHDHGPSGHSHVPPPEAGGDGPPWRGLIALGLADGLVPTPSTLVVLLAAVSLDRVPLGLALIAAFSLGFGAVLTALALAFVYARRWFARVRSERRRLQFASRFALGSALPMLAALVLMAVGLTLSARSLGDVM